jgi:hypothetical protein
MSLTRLTSLKEGRRFPVHVLETALKKKEPDAAGAAENAAPSSSTHTPHERPHDGGDDSGAKTTSDLHPGEDAPPNSTSSSTTTTAATPVKTSHAAATAAEIAVASSVDLELEKEVRRVRHAIPPSFIMTTGSGSGRSGDHGGANSSSSSSAAAVVVAVAAAEELLARLQHHTEQVAACLLQAWARSLKPKIYLYNAVFACLAMQRMFRGHMVRSQSDAWLERSESRGEEENEIMPTALLRAC